MGLPNSRPDLQRFVGRNQNYYPWITGERGTLVVGKELEIRRALSRSHLYSSAFVVDRDDASRFVLRGAGWGHGVGLCQIGAAVMATESRSYREILAHYYPGTTVERVAPG